MKFHKDILIIDFEGIKHPVQIGAVLLDKETLEEKDSFNSYIYADLDGYVSPKSGITQEMINDAPQPVEVGKMLREKFGTDLFISSFVQNLDINHFKMVMSIEGNDFRDSGYDFHILDIWPIAYLNALKNDYTGGTGSEELFQYYGAKPRGLHNALEDCRITADVLRKVCFN